MLAAKTHLRGRQVGAVGKVEGSFLFATFLCRCRYSSCGLVVPAGLLARLVLLSEDGLVRVGQAVGAEGFAGGVLSEDGS